MSIQSKKINFLISEINAEENNVLNLTVPASFQFDVKIKSFSSYIVWSQSPPLPLPNSALKNLLISSIITCGSKL